MKAGRGRRTDRIYPGARWRRRRRGGDNLDTARFILSKFRPGSEFLTTSVPRSVKALTLLRLGTLPPGTVWMCRQNVGNVNDLGGAQPSAEGVQTAAAGSRVDSTGPGGVVQHPAAVPVSHEPGSDRC